MRVRDSNSVAGHYGSVSLPEANYWSQSAFYSFNVDNDVPVVKQAAFSPISGSFVNGSFTLTGSVTEDKGLAEIRIFINEIDRGTATPGGSAPDFTFSYAVNQAHLTGAGGANSIRVQATDNSGKIGIGTVQIIFDDNPPAVSFLTPDDGSTVNGIITVSGTASDNNQVASLHRAVMPAAVPPSWPGDYVPLAGQKYAFSFSLNTATLSEIGRAHV